MDEDSVSQPEIERAFRFIRRVNRWLGGTKSCLRAMLSDRKRWPKKRPIRWLDLGTGAADIPLAIDAWALRRKIAVECVAVDKHPACLRVARAAVGEHPRIRVLEADALSLRTMFPPFSFDYVHAGMFLHHLADDDVIRALRVMGRLASRRVIWNDLLRSRLSSIAIRCVTIGQPAIVRDDALLSVQKGFTPEEAVEAARWAGLSNISIRTSAIWGRFVLTGQSQG